MSSRAEAARQRRRSRGISAAAPALLALALLAFSACGDAADDAPPPLTVDAPPFDAPQAYALLVRQVEFGPRVPGTPGHAAQLAWMQEYLGERADTVILQEFTHVRPETGERVPMANVFARFQPDHPDRILLVAHWDTRPTAEEDPDPARRDDPILGANDGASGTAVLLQMADVLSSHSPPVGVDLLFTDGEDFAPGEMYLGATYFAANLPPGYRPLYGIVVDLVADENPRFPVEPHSAEFAPEVVTRVWSMAERLGLATVFPDRTGQPVIDDHIPLNRAGIRTIVIIDFDYGPGNRYWHTTEDVLENTSPAGLEAVGRVLNALVYSGG